MEYPVVVKIGGSLIDCLDPILDALHRQRLPVLIVPGGGKFADQVRKTGISGDAAHWMAIAAMEQMGWYIASKGVRTVTSLQVPAQREVLLPYTLPQKQRPAPSFLGCNFRYHLGMDRFPPLPSPDPPQIG